MRAQRQDGPQATTKLGLVGRAASPSDGLPRGCRLLCALLFHPLLERDPRAGVKHCTCGRVRVSDEQWLATFPLG